MTTPIPSPLIFGKQPPNVTCRERPAAYAVIHNSDRHVAAVRLAIGDRDYFILPGGGTHAGESAQQTVAREVREELARSATLQRILGRVIQYFFAALDDCWYKMTAHFFTAQFQGDCKGCGEFDLHWIDPSLHQTDFFYESHSWAASQTEKG